MKIKIIKYFKKNMKSKFAPNELFKNCQLNENVVTHAGNYTCYLKFLNLLMVSHKYHGK